MNQTVESITRPVDWLTVLVCGLVKAAQRESRVITANASNRNVAMATPSNGSESDGISDTIEETQDTDSNGVPEYLDIDSYNDGIPDRTETDQDPDSDNTPDFRDANSNNKGLSDLLEAGATELQDQYRRD